MTATKIAVAKLDKTLREYNRSANIEYCQWVECKILSDSSIPLIIKQYIVSIRLCRHLLKSINVTTSMNCSSEC